MSRLSSNLLLLRNRHFFVLDAVILALAPTLALALRLDGFNAVPAYGTELLVYSALATLVSLPIYYRFGLYARFWRYASIDELRRIGLAVAVSLAVVLVPFYVLRLLPVETTADSGAVVRYIFAFAGVPRSVPFIAGLLVLVAVGGSRFSVRLADLQPSRAGGAETRRVLVMGAGDAGAMIVREMRRNPQLGMEAVGFLDDDESKWGVRIHGVDVVGGREQIAAQAKIRRAEQVIIAMPTVSGRTIREILALCEQAGVAAKTIPGIYELLDGTVSISQLRDVAIEDLLRRAPVQTDVGAVRALLHGKRVLVTGGGGSIGGELCRQILHCGPASLVVLGHGENSIFRIMRELGQEAGNGPAVGNGYLDPVKEGGVPIRARIADIRFPERLGHLFEEHRPEIVFHAAAHKHVPLMEMNPAEAVTNNILGTRNLLKASLDASVERFVMISSDKAVNPTNVMGASKRVAELLVHQSAAESGRPYVAVRFGNVLGSRGSVVLTFQEQIKSGGPVTVTHPEMRRYFMTISEAVQLVLQAAAIGDGGEVFVLDMGEPVRIADLARDLIELSGLEVKKDIEIVFTEPRAGDKLFEQLFLDGEEYERTSHEKIFTACNAGAFVPETLAQSMSRLEAAAALDDRQAIVAALQAVVPEYRPVRQAGDTADARASRSQHI